jgi:hypothetical protein
MPAAADNEHERPPTASDDDIAAVGKMTEALESLERARGHLYSFHQLVGKADLALDDVAALLADGGHKELLNSLESDLLGRNVLAGRWTFQVIEEFDDGYYAAFREHEGAIREALAGGRRHVYEAEMKERRRTAQRAGHEASPAEAGESADPAAG